MSRTPAQQPPAAAMPETPDFDSDPVEQRPVRVEPIACGASVDMTAEFSLQAFERAALLRPFSHG